MPEPVKVTKVPSFKTPQDFQNFTRALGLDIPCDDAIIKGSGSPLAQPLHGIVINGKTITNRCVIHPMEGWDAAPDGSVTPDVRRRWERFGESGAKLIFGGEAMAVRMDGRANPNQLVIAEHTLADLAELRNVLLAAHKQRYGNADDVIVGFQLTHSGRFCKPASKTRFESKVAYRHPVLDRKFGVTSDAQVFTDSELDYLVEDYAAAAGVAWKAGADFVDIKHCHGYLLHELLSGFTRPGKYGGSFENRTRFLRNVVGAIRACGNAIELGVRLSAFDFPPFHPNPDSSAPGKPGIGVPDNFPLPYSYGFGCNHAAPLQIELLETHQFVALCAKLGVKLLNVTAGSPYYNPHIQRPAAYPPSDGYLPPEDPLVGVARQIHVTREIRNQAPNSLAIIGTAYSYLQEFLPHVAQAVLRHGWVDMVGIGRMVLSYPSIFMDAVDSGTLTPRLICRTFSDCTTAPRNGMISGCYPLDNYYASKAEAQQLKEMKRASSKT